METVSALNFKAFHDSLDRIEVQLNGERRRRRQEIEEEWNTQCRMFQESPSFDAASLEELSVIFVHANRPESLDIRVMEDCVSRIRNFGSEERSYLVRDSYFGERGWLEEFARFRASISDPSAHAKDSSGLKALQ